jgi:hypothetical protein
MNDIVLLPIVLVAMAFLDQSAPPSTDQLVRLGLDILILGPGAGIGVGLLAVATMDLIRKRFGIRRDYESLYSLGVAFTAYAAAEAVHGSGFLAAFAAGLTISALDIELCDCFLEYGETTSEMALLLTFVLFGGSLIWSGFGILTLTTLAFAVVALLVRPVAFLIALAPIKLIPRSRWLIAWYGPRGLSTLLLVLLAVFASAPGSEYLFQICCLVVLLSILTHGFSPTLISRSRAKSKTRSLQTGPAGLEPEPVTPLPAELPVESPGREEVQTPATDGEKTVFPGPTKELPARPVSPEPSLNGQVEKPIKQPLNFSPLTSPLATLRSTGLLSRPEPPAPPLQTPPHSISPAIPDGSTPGEAGAISETDEVRARVSHEFISLDGFKDLLKKGEPVVILDVRTERTFELDQKQAQGAVRLNPMYAVKQATEKNLPMNSWLIAYCA